jgi:hypothetical protein
VPEAGGRLDDLARHVPGRLMIVDDRDGHFR